MHYVNTHIDEVKLIVKTLSKSEVETLIEQIRSQYTGEFLLKERHQNNSVFFFARKNRKCNEFNRSLGSIWIKIIKYRHDSYKPDLQVKFNPDSIHISKIIEILNSIFILVKHAKQRLKISSLDVAVNFEAATKNLIIDKHRYKKSRLEYFTTVYLNSPSERGKSDLRVYNKSKYKQKYSISLKNLKPRKEINSLWRAEAKYAIKPAISIFDLEIRSIADDQVFKDIIKPHLYRLCSLLIIESVEFERLAKALPKSSKKFFSEYLFHANVHSLGRVVPEGIALSVNDEAQSSTKKESDRFLRLLKKINSKSRYQTKVMSQAQTDAYFSLLALSSMLQHCCDNDE